MSKKRSKSPARSDQKLTQEIQDALKLDNSVPEERIAVEVSDGSVTLSGNVNGLFQKEAAEYDTKRIRGVRAVTNLINVSAR